jgi:hypothetical protein
VLSHCRREEPHVRGCWVIDRILSFDAGPAAPVPAPALPSGARPVASARALELRTRFAEFLGPKKFRRAVRLAVAQAPGPGRVCCPARWEDFVRIHPECKLEDDELAEVFAFCVVHGCEMTERVLRGACDDPELLRNPEFLHARGTQFPYAHAPEGEGEWEARTWICPECQRLRHEWVAAHA